MYLCLSLSLYIYISTSTCIFASPDSSLTWGFYVKQFHLALCTRIICRKTMRYPMGQSCHVLPCKGSFALSEPLSGMDPRPTGCMMAWLCRITIMTIEGVQTIEPFAEFRSLGMPKIRPALILLILKPRRALPSLAILYSHYGLWYIHYIPTIFQLFSRHTVIFSYQDTYETIKYVLPVICSTYTILYL